MDTSRKTLFTLVMILVVLASTDSKAIPIDLTSGRINMNTTTPAPFDDVFVSLRGPGFALDNNFLRDSFHFTGTPNPAFIVLSPGTPVTFTGEASLRTPDLLVLNGVSYQASGNISVVTPQVFVSPLLTAPFSLTGTIHGQSLTSAQTVDVSVSGHGVVTAQFLQFPDGFSHLRSVTYDIIPEPTTLLLLASGLAGLGLRLLMPRAFSRIAHTLTNSRLSAHMT